MSLVKISGNASGTGTLTIAAPNTNTDRTLTLPDNTGTILTNATTTGFPAGSVLQVVQQHLQPIQILDCQHQLLRHHLLLKF
jgi:hypothetical protein